MAFWQRHEKLSGRTESRSPHDARAIEAKRIASKTRFICALGQATKRRELAKSHLEKLWIRATSSLASCQSTLRGVEARCKEKIWFGNTKRISTNNTNRPTTREGVSRIKGLQEQITSICYGIEPPLVPEIGIADF